MKRQGKHSKKAAALKYRPGQDSAPRLVAKGRGAVADKIIEIARAHGIPLKEDKELIEFLSVVDLTRRSPRNSTAQ